jgi:hypothetical protein
MKVTGSEPGFSNERRLDPQITIGLLTDASGFPLMLNAFEGNRAETTTMLPAVEAFMAAHHLKDVTIVADAGMISDANKKAIEAAGLSFILGARISEVPFLIHQWHQDNPDQEIPDGHIFTQPWPPGPNEHRRDQTIFYQYRADRARRTLRGIDEQIAKAEKAVDGKVPVKRNRFIKLTGATKASTGNWSPKPVPWQGSRATSPTLTPPPSSSSAPTIACSRSRSRFACPNTTFKPGPSTTTNANPSTPT